jgi:hypothetical protein
LGLFSPVPAPLEDFFLISLINIINIYLPHHFITGKAEMTSQSSQSSMGGIQMEANGNPTRTAE